MKRRILIQIGLLLVLICLFAIFRTIFKSDYTEVNIIPQTKKLNCVFAEIKTHWINSEYAYIVTTQSNDTFYIMPERINDFEYSGILKRLKKNSESQILYRQTRNKYKSIEQITHRGKTYMGVREELTKVKRNTENDNLIIGGSTVGLVLLLVCFIVCLPFKETRQIKNALIYHSSIKALSFPVAKGDLRISKVKVFQLINR